MHLRSPVLLAAILLAVAGLAVALALHLHGFGAAEGGGGGSSGSKVAITVCNAGSLTIPLQKVAELFEQEYGISVRLEPSGSVEAVRKVTDFGRNCDVVAVADYRLIPMFMVPRYANWYVAFASNSIVVAFTNHSKLADRVKSLANPLELFSLLANSSSVRYGFSDPNRDPCGYRSVGVIGLVALQTGDMSLLERLVIEKIPGSRYELVNGTLHIYIPASFEPRGNLVVRPKSVDLIALLESGAVDYVFEYRSVAVQHGLEYIELPPTVNLADPGMAKLYGRVVVHILTGTPKEKAITMAPIVYGVTVPLTAEHKREALLFVRFLLERGAQVFREYGQPFLEQPLGFGKLPGEVAGLVRVVEG